MNVFHLNINTRAFNAMINGTKNVEVRANKKSHKPHAINKVRAGDVIIFKDITSNQRISCTAERITLYKTVRELLLKEGTIHTLSSTNDLEKGIKSIESISGYKEHIAQNGVFALKIMNVKPYEQISTLFPQTTLESS